MSEKYIVEYCSPTLAGIKTGNLFSVKTDKGEDINRELRALNKILTGRGLRAIPVKYTGKYILIYIYRPAFLTRDLQRPDARRILEKKGYSCKDADFCLMQLIRRLKEDDNFPHEIGLFLGYPPSDVAAFMEDAGKGVKYVGCWKAYGNEHEAKKISHRYKKCTEIYQRELKKGRS